MSSAITQRWLSQAVLPYPNSQRVYADTDALLAAYNTLRPKSDVYTFDDGRTQLLLCVHGLLPITYRQATYNIPVAVWITRDYPQQPPIVYVVPTNDILVKPGKFVDPSGRCTIEYIQHWERKPEGCSLSPLFQALQDHFSREPPVYSRPSVNQSRPDRPPPPLPPSTQSPPPRPPALPAKPYTASASASSTASTNTPQPPPLPPHPPHVSPAPFIGHIPPATYPVGPVPPLFRPFDSASTSVPLPSRTAPPFPVLSPPLPPPPPLQHQHTPLASPPPSHPSTVIPAYPSRPEPPHPPIPNLLDQDNDSSVFDNSPSAFPAPPPRPPNPELVRLQSEVHQKLSSELNSLSQALATDAERLRAQQADLLAGEPAIKDEMARLEAVRDVCRNVANRTRQAVQQAESNIAELRRKGDPEVDELVCATSIMHNQLINLIADDNAIEDTIYHLHRALNAGRIDLERFLRATRLLAEEQFMKRALLEKIQSNMLAMPSPSLVSDWT